MEENFSFVGNGFQWCFSGVWMNCPEKDEDVLTYWDCNDEWIQSWKNPDNMGTLP